MLDPHLQELALVHLCMQQFPLQLSHSPRPTFTPKIKYSLSITIRLPLQTRESWQLGQDWKGRVCGKAWDSHISDN